MNATQIKLVTTHDEVQVWGWEGRYRLYRPMMGVTVEEARAWAEERFPGLPIVVEDDAERARRKAYIESL